MPQPGRILVGGTEFFRVYRGNTLIFDAGESPLPEGVFNVVSGADNVVSGADNVVVNLGGATGLVTAGLRGEYRFDAGSGNTLVDHGPDARHGTLGAVPSRPTWVPMGLSFDGVDDHVDLPTAGMPVGNHDLTFQVVAVMPGSGVAASGDFVSFGSAAAGQLFSLRHDTTANTVGATTSGENVDLTISPAPTWAGLILTVTARYRASDRRLSVVLDDFVQEASALLSTGLDLQATPGFRFSRRVDGTEPLKATVVAALVYDAHLNDGQVSRNVAYLQTLLTPTTIPGFSPADLPGVLLWTGPATGQVLVKDAADADRVSRWDDGSGTNHWLQAAEAQRPYWLLDQDGPKPAAHFPAAHLMVSTRNCGDMWVVSGPNDTDRDAEVWVRFLANSWTNGTSGHHLLNINQQTTTNALQIRWSTTQFQFVYRNVSNTLTALSAALPTLGEWHVARLRKVSGIVTGYLDGVQVVQATDSRTSVLTGGGAVPMQLGGREDLSNFVDAKVAHVYVGNVPLSDAQAANLLDFMLAGTGGGGPEPEPTISASPVSMETGDPITVTVADGPANADGSGNGTDWVGLFPVGGAPGSEVAEKYLSNTSSYPNPALTGATLNFTAPSTPGTYEFRFYAEDAYDVLLATSQSITVVPPPFDPADLPGTVMHLASDGSKVLVNDGTADRLAEWTDDGGNHLAQPTVAFRPVWLTNQVNGKPAADFQSATGADAGHYLASVLNASSFWAANVDTQAEIWAVFRADVLRTQSHLVSVNQSNSSNSFQLRWISSALQVAYRDTTNNLVSISTSSGFVADTWYLARAQKNGATVTGWLGGVQFGQGTNARDPVFTGGGAVPVMVGGKANVGVLTDLMDGKVAEVWVGKSVLSSEDAAALQSYFNAKYGF